MASTSCQNCLLLSYTLPTTYIAPTLSVEWVFWLLSNYKCPRCSPQGWEQNGGVFWHGLQELPCGKDRQHHFQRSREIGTKHPPYRYSLSCCHSSWQWGQSAVLKSTSGIYWKWWPGLSKWNTHYNRGWRIKKKIDQGPNFQPRPGPKNYWATLRIHMEDNGGHATTY